MNTLVFGSGREKGVSLTVGKTVLLICVGWFAAVLVTALAGGFDTPAGERPLVILLAVTIPVVVYTAAYLTSGAFRDWVLALDMRLLILLHSWRMVGAGFVMLYFYGRLPAVFALPAGLGDAMAAVAAVFIAVALYQHSAAVARQRVYFWNTLGLLDFVVAITLGVMTRTGEVLHGSGQVSSDIMGSFPLALIPGFAVPFYVITHLMIYAQLRRRLPVN
jgi:hypothetical protein